MRFLGVEIGFKLPDKNTIFDFKEALKIGETDHKLFNLFLKNLEENGVVMHEGTIIDASFVDVPKQRNSHRENEIIKSGEVPIDMIAKGKNSFCQKDLEAQWTKKNNETHYGYKDHVKIDKNTKIITGFEVTDASVHDSQKFVELIDENDVEVWADSAYVGKTFEKEIKEKQPTIKLHICEKGYKKHPLTDEQKASNKEKSRVRCRVEHVFGYLSGGVREMTARCIGFSRVAREICEKNLAYNLQRYAYLASR
jgi:IS5 family transposase